jgi:hypothetical protein
VALVMTGAAATVLVICAAPAHAAPPLAAHAKGTSYFSATTTASAIHVSFTQSPAASIITGSLVNDAAGYATSGFASGGGSQAAAAPLYPGTLVVGGPGLLCSDLFTCPVAPPPYPLLADASYPRTPNAHVSTSEPHSLGKVLSVTPSLATAHAHTGGNAATTSTGRVSMLGGTRLDVSVGSSVATTQTTTHGSVLRVRVRSAVSDIAVGPLLRIGEVRTTDLLTLQPGHAPVDHPHVTIGHVTVAGQAASITRHGIVAAGHPTGSSLATKLVRSGIEVRSLGVNRTDHTNSARSSAGGVEIDFAAPVKGLPYIPNPLSGLPGLDQVPGVDLKGTYLGVIQLGGAGAAGALQHQRGLPALPPASTTGRSPDPGAGGHPGTAAVAAVQRPQAAPPSPAVAAPPSAPATLLSGLSRISLMTLYLVLALGTAGLFLGWRGTVGYRRRSSTPGRGR